MSTQKVKQADFTFALPNPDLADLTSVQEMVAKATRSDGFAHLVQQMNAEALHHPAPVAPSPLGKPKGVDLTFSGTAGSTGGKPSGSGTVTLTIHF